MFFFYLVYFLFSGWIRSIWLLNLNYHGCANFTSVAIICQQSKLLRNNYRVANYSRKQTDDPSATISGLIEHKVLILLLLKNARIGQCGSLSIRSISHFADRNTLTGIPDNKQMTGWICNVFIFIFETHYNTIQWKRSLMHFNEMDNRIRMKWFLFVRIRGDFCCM